MNTKICCRCRLEKYLEEFSKSKTRGTQAFCKSCMREYQRNRPRKKLTVEERIRGSEIRKQRYDRLKKTNETYYQKNKEKILKQQKEYISREDVKLNRRKLLRNYMRKRCSEDPSFRIRRTISVRIWHALNNTCKSKKTMELVGCDISHLKSHIENNFRDGMTWENYGKWHIDHIIPCASFDLSIEKNQKKCFHYTNLQPLWAEENFKKGDNLPLTNSP